MAQIFKQYAAANVGTTETVVKQFTTKSLLLNLNLANKSAQILPVSVYIKKADDSIFHIIKDARVDGNFNKEIMQGNKIVLELNDKVCVKTADENAYDVILSVLEGID